jgi:glycine cleavage system H protein
MTPEALLYSKTHEWVHLETAAPGERIATVGISALAVEQLADLVYIELPQVGQQVTAGEPFAELESAKAVCDLYSPVEGQIIEVNGRLADSPESLATDPFGAGWLVKIRLSSEAALGELLDYAAYWRDCDQPASDDQ